MTITTHEGRNRKQELEQQTQIQTAAFCAEICAQRVVKALRVVKAVTIKPYI
jgi:hypothetical protein